MLACAHRNLNMILVEDSIWKIALRATVDLAFPVSLKAEDGLTWRYLAMQVLEGLGRLEQPAAKVRTSTTYLVAAVWRLLASLDIQPPI